jgi:vacuolar-type H+-ATPase subunit H
MARGFTHGITHPYSRQASDILQSQRTELEMTAESIRDDPTLHNLDVNEAHQVADVFEAAGLVFRQALTRAPQS